MYEVEQIVGKRIDPLTNGLEYFVKWVNYPPQENTWQPQKNLKFVKNLIQDFNKKNQFQGNLELNSNKQNMKKQIMDRIKGGNLNKNNPSLIKVNINFRQNFDQAQFLQQNIFFQQESQKESKQKSKQDSDFDEQQQKKKNKKQQFKKKQIQINQNSKNIKSQVLKTNLLNKFQLKDRFTENTDSSNKNLFKNIQSQNKQRNIFQKSTLMIGNAFMNKKIPPPLPPDFSLNKYQYMNPKPNQPQITNKFQQNPNKPIQRKINSEKAQSTFESYIKAIKTQPNQPLQRKIHLHNRLKTPPPPPPNYNNKYKPYQIAHQTNSNIISQSHQTPKQPQSFPANRTHQQTKQHSLQKQFKYFNNDSQQFKQYSSNNNIKINNNNNKNSNNSAYNLSNLQIFQQPLQKQQKFSQIIEILKMDKTQQGFIYLTNTDKGQMWLTRSQLVPRFSTALVIFYEKYITFND